MSHPKKYYWLNFVNLEPGSIVNPGTWVRIKRTTPPGDNWALLEEVYERIRRDEFSDLVSRTNANFLFQELELARRYQAENRQGDLLYEVELVDGTAPTGVLDMQIVIPWIVNVKQFTVAELENQSRAYWKSANPAVIKATPEVVTESKIRILKCIANQ